MLQYLGFKQRAGICFAAILLGSLFPTDLRAQTDLPTKLPTTTSALSLSVEPGVVFLHTKPGQSVQHTITLTYTGNTVIQVTPELAEFTSDDKTGNPVMLPKTHVDFVSILEPNINLGQSFTMKPNTTSKVVIEIAPPASTPDAEFPLTLLFKTTPSFNLSAGGAVAQASAIIGSHFITYVGSTEPTQASPEVLAIESSRFVDSFSSVSFKILLTNKSKSSTVVSGYAVVRNWLNQEVAHFTFAKTALLGTSSRYAQYTLADNQDHTQATELFTYKPAYLLGPYSIEVVLTNPQQEHEVVFRTSKNILALPFSLSLAVGLTITTYIAFAIVRSRKAVFP